MTYKLLFTFSLLLALFLNSCGSSSSTDEEQLFSFQEKEFLHNLFLTEYLWYDQVASDVDYTLYDNPKSMVNALRINPPDAWSFTITQQAYEDYANQKTEGFGFGYTADFFIYLVRINAPAYEKLFRGDKILKINNNPVSKNLINQASQDLNIETTFTLVRDDREINVTLTPSAYTFNVSQGEILTQKDKKVGYLRYDAFTESSVSEFETIFTAFHNENIDELVIDMRYNGGGSVTTASMLLDNITNAYPGQRQIHLDWNPSYQNNNENYLFEDASLQDGNELNMQRVFFLVTKSTASASEAVISALIPYMGEHNIITIGEETYGKPVGMSGRAYGKNYYFLINFFVKNRHGDTGSFNGIASTCTAEDDLTHLRGDKNETMLKTALYYMENSSCP